MTLNKLLFLGFLLLSTSTMQAQTQLKQFGTKIFDETGRTVKLSKAIEISKLKSEKAYIAFRLAEGLSDGRTNDIITGYGTGLLAVVPLGADYFGYLRYTWVNAYFAATSILSFTLKTNKKEIEDVLAIGVKAFNESSTTNE
ncbi:MAG: hypothetical protein HQ470_04130 [Methylophilales bacterium]|nr:hypothetical protein [Methylophilales bacterium]